MGSEFSPLVRKATNEADSNSREPEVAYKRALSKDSVLESGVLL